MAPIDTADVWDLGSSPSTLEEQAAAWRSLRDAARSAQEAIDLAANDIISNDAWTGDTARSYDLHRVGVTADLSQMATSCGSAADALDHLAGVLRFNQELLSSERSRLRDVPVSKSGDTLTFDPADETQAALVRACIASAVDIREHVDDEITIKTSDLRAAEEQFGSIHERWQPRTFGMLNLNIGQGYKNSPFNSDGTDRSDLDLIADVIAGADVDVVTMQEVFGSDVPRLEEELRARTGENWTIHFGEASEKPYWSDGRIPIGMHEPFGNAVAVRHEGPIAGSEHTDTIKLDVSGSIVSGSGPPTGTTTPGTTAPPEPIVTDGEGRSATEVHVSFAEPG